MVDVFTHHCLLWRKIDQCEPIERSWNCMLHEASFCNGGVLVKESPGKPYPNGISSHEMLRSWSSSFAYTASVQRSFGHIGQRLGSQESAVELDVLHTRTNNYSSVEMAPSKATHQRNSGLFCHTYEHRIKFQKPRIAASLLQHSSAFFFFNRLFSEHLEKWCKFFV